MNSIKKELKVKAKTLKIVGGTALATVAATPMMSFAEQKTAKSMVNSLLGYIFGIFFWIGILLLAWGVGQLVLAFKNEDADSKSRAMLVIMASIVLTLVGSIVKAVVGTDAVSASTDTNF